MGQDPSDTHAAELFASRHCLFKLQRLRNGVVGNLKPSAAARARSCKMGKDEMRGEREGLWGRVPLHLRTFCKFISEADSVRACVHISISAVVGVVAVSPRLLGGGAAGSRRSPGSITVNVPCRAIYNSCQLTGSRKSIRT